MHSRGSSKHKKRKHKKQKGKRKDSAVIENKDSVMSYPNDAS